MKEMDDINRLVKGELLTEQDAKTALLLLFGVSERNELTFTDKELFKIYVDVKCRINYAPEENEEFETELTKSIIEKIENYVCKRFVYMHSATKI
jgi:hypothetical protein